MAWDPMMVLWAGLLLVFGLLLICTEVLVPGGIVGVIGLLMLMGSVVLVFVEFGTLAGCVHLVIVAICSGLAFRIMVRVLLKTRLGGRIVHRKNLHESKSFGTDHDSLVGKRGEAMTNLRPAGAARIEGQRMDVVTEGLFVEKGAPVQVLSVEGAKILVREVKTPS